MRSIGLCLLGAVAATGAAGAGPSAPPVVGCDQIILQAASPTQGGYRRVLGVFSVPPAYIAQVVDTESRPWRYWEKAGLVVLANARPVTVTVPVAWKKRVAIQWGNSGTVSSLRIAPCPSPPRRWNAYAGGFSLTTPSACFPLTFTVGGRSQTVRFGLGKRCL